MDNHQLRAIGWKPFFEQQVSPEMLGSAVLARVSAHYGSQILLLGAAGEFRIPVQLAECVGEIAVGDWLVLTAEDHRAVQRLERQTLLFRKASGEEVGQEKGTGVNFNNDSRPLFFPRFGFGRLYPPLFFHLIA